MCECVRELKFFPIFILFLVLPILSILWMPHSALCGSADILQKISGLDLKTKSNRTLVFKEQKLGAVIIFVSSRCPCSDSYLNSSHPVSVLRRLQEKFSKQGFTFLGVHSNANETTEKDLDYFKTSDLPFPVIQDGECQLANYFEAHSTPHAFVVSPSGKILYRGGVADRAHADRAQIHYLENALQDLVEGKKPRVTESRVLGCHIQRP
jgi:thioredoxin-related protein